MDLFKPEPDANGKPVDHESRGAVGRTPVTNGLANDTPVQAIQSEAVSIASDGNCCVLKNSNFSGRLRFEGAARIECQVAGEIHGTGIITIAESAVVTGPIRAARVLIAGRVRADITASEGIEVRSSGRVSGTLTAPAMKVHENAFIEGRFQMTPDRYRRAL